nr:DNA repair and recombination protein RAD54B-like [Rhipicephalus microplus]
MRKSSILQQSANKKFNSPFLKPRSTASPAIEKVQQDIHIAATGSDNVVRKRSISDIMNLVNQPQPPQDAVKKVCIEHSRSVIPSPSFGSPHDESCHKSPSAPPTPPKSIGTQLPLSDASGASTNARYYSVVWCKKSMKKHKKWEGDAVLIIKGRSATLRSLEGKELSSAFGYKVKEVDAIEEGSIFSIGGKECEIQASISTEDYLSGRCFSDGFVPAATQEDSKQSSSAPTLKTSAQQNPTVKFPAFRSPHVGGLPPNASSKKIFVLPPSPQIKQDSLVMPRPNNIHQWDNNKKNLPVTDVVVEDSLTRCLRPHQREGVVFLYECIMQMRAFDGCGAILADEMGLGKTLQCITLIWTLLRQGPYGGQPCLRKVIIVTPSSLVKNWVKEFKKWLPNRNLRVYHVDQNNKIDIFLNDPSMYPVLILSYEMYMRASDRLSRINFDLLICDEAHRLKNANIKTTESLQNLGTLRRILLTGTPVQNDLQEFFALVDFCNPGILGKSSSFRRIYEEPILRSQLPGATEEEKELGPARANELMQTTSPFILRRTQDVIQSYLPGKVECVVFCRPQPLQLALYQNMLETSMVRACLSSYLSTDANCHLACILALRKLCNHPLLVASQEFADKDEDVGLAALHAEARRGLQSEFDPTMMELESGSGKLVVLAAMLHSLWTSQPRERIVLVSNFTKTLDILEDICMQKGYPFLRLDGSTSSTQRLELVERFNSPHSNCFVFLLSCKAGGVGLNLVGASRIVLYDVDWNPANDLQAMARVWRDGQSRHVSIYRLLTTGTIEEKIFQRQVTKQELSGAVLDSKKDGKRAKFSLEDLKDLFTLDEETTSSTHRLLGCRCDSVEDTDGDFSDSHSRAEVVAEPSGAPKRSSQLGSATTPSIIGQKLGMSDLLRWEHISAPIGKHFSQDPHLAAAEDHITFVFRNTLCKAQKENVGGHL